MTGFSMTGFSAAVQAARQGNHVNQVERDGNRAQILLVPTLTQAIDLASRNRA